MVQASRLAGRGGLVKALWKLRRFLLCAFVFSTFDMAMQNPLDAFLYSLVECAAPAPEADAPGATPKCPEGSVLDLSGQECLARPRSSDGWSLSPHCMDRAYVVKTATRMRGAVQIAHQVVSIAVLLFVGPAVDSWGRRPVLLLSLCSQALFSSALLAAALVGASDLPVATAFLVLAYVGCGSGVSLFNPAASATVADLSRGNASLRGDGYAALGVVANVSLVVGFAAMYPVLQLRLTNYAPVWAGFVALSVLAVLANGCLLRETLPPQEKEDGAHLTSPQQSACRRVAAQLTTGLRVVKADPVLMILVLVVAFAFMAVMGSIPLFTSYQVTVLGYSNAKASVCAMVLPVLGMLASALASPLIRRLGVRALLLAALGVAAVGFAVMGGGAAAEDVRATEGAFWVGVIAMSICWNLMKPCFQTIVSTRVALENQGNVFALQQLLVAVLQVSLGLLWPEVLFDAEAAGARRGAAFLASAAVLCVCAAVLWAASRTARAEHTESSDGESGDEACAQVSKAASRKGQQQPTPADAV